MGTVGGQERKFRDAVQGDGAAGRGVARRNICRNKNYSNPYFVRANSFLLIFGAAIWVFPKIVVSPKWMVYNGKPYQNGCFGGGFHPPFKETPNCSNPEISGGRFFVGLGVVWQILLHELLGLLFDILST